MRLTTELLAPFNGGQIEVQNNTEGYVFRGEIKTAEVNEMDELSIGLAWMAKAEGVERGAQFPVPTGWSNEPNLTYQHSLEVCRVHNVGPGNIGGNRIMIESPYTGETIVLFTPDISKFDPSVVKGLVLATEESI